MMETRHCPQEVKVDVRQVDGTQLKQIIGYAAVYYRAGDPSTEFHMFGDLVERIMPGAFDGMVAEDDVRALVNHDRNRLLGRTTAGTLRLYADDVGLRYEIDVPDTQAGRDAVVSVQRRDMTGSSFAFVTKGGKRGKVLWREEGDTDIREIHNLEGFDVGPVTYPAYQGTSSEARDLVRSELEGVRQERLLAQRDEWLRDSKHCLTAARARMSLWSMV